ncbi:MAG: hypothetical protein J7L23_02540 [Candidatus Diapherotrites archaeon]|nr:hypothetical protein [Candidatus Diapherotrites archaeon]
MEKLDWVPELKEKELEAIIKKIKETKGKEHSRRAEELAAHLNKVFDAKEVYHYWPDKTIYGKVWSHAVAKESAWNLLSMLNHNGELSHSDINEALRLAVERIRKENEKKDILHQANKFMRNDRARRRALDGRR